MFMEFHIRQPTACQSAAKLMMFCTCISTGSHLTCKPTCLGLRSEQLITWPTHSRETVSHPHSHPTNANVPGCCWMVCRAGYLLILHNLSASQVKSEWSLQDIVMTVTMYFTSVLKGNLMGNITMFICTGEYWYNSSVID